MKQLGIQRGYRELAEKVLEAALEDMEHCKYDRDILEIITFFESGAYSLYCQLSNTEEELIYEKYAELKQKRGFSRYRPIHELNEPCEGYTQWVYMRPAEGPAIRFDGIKRAANKLKVPKETILRYALTHKRCQGYRIEIVSHKTL